MMKKKCPDCGKFMALTNRLPYEDEFDEELALECGITEEQINTIFPGDAPLNRFTYVQDMWECSGCDTLFWHTEGEKYYYNPETNNYDAPKPITLKEQAEIERLKQEAAGQLRLL